MSSGSTTDSDADSGAVARTAKRYAGQWHYRPSERIATSPVFQWPPKLQAALRWFMARWLVLGENLIIAILSTVTWLYFHPPMEQIKTFALDWFALMYLRNFILITVVAGGLHLLLHVRRTQGNRLRFDLRDFATRARAFTFDHQVRDNMFWTLGSGVFFWTSYEAVMLWAMANGYAPMLSFQEHPVWFIGLLLLTPLWISFHFYFVHRALHWPPLYKLAHALHHRNTNVGPWSGLSMHPVEHLLWMSSVLIHWLVAAHPIHIVFHMQHQALTAATSHAGFEGLLIKDRRALALGNFHHQLHHRYFECNYGNLEVPWDKCFGSFHDGTEAAHSAFVRRRRHRARN